MKRLLSDMSMFQKLGAGTMPTPELPNEPSGAETNAERSSQRSIVGLSTEPSPIRFGRSVTRDACSDGFEPSTTVIGKPVGAVVAKLVDQPPSTASSARFQPLPNWRSRPNGRS